MKKWTLTDCCPDDAGPPSIEEIPSAAELRRRLDAFVRGAPRPIMIESPGGEVLVAGVGGDFAGIRWTKVPYREHLKFAIARPIEASEPADFSRDENLLEFDPEHLLRPEKAIEVILFFFEHGVLPDWIEWEEW